MTQNENLIDALKESNKWWKSEFELDFKSREIYKEIEKFLEAKQIIALTGLRRVGKTTIMLKIIQDNINKIDAKNILYFSFDDFKNVRIKDVLNAYAIIMNKNLNEGKYLILFDEIQKLESWEEQIKRIYDNFPNFKIIISGSESLFIRRKSKESLAGRIFEFKVNPLNFREYLVFKQIKTDNLELYKQEILIAFNNYLNCSGFPEIINEDKEFIKKYIKENIIEKIAYKDIPYIFSVNEPEILEQVLRNVLLNPGEMININKLAGDLGTSRQTVSNYLNYLEKSFLIRKLYNFSKNLRKSQRSLKKYYPVILLPEVVEKSEMAGKIFETVLVLQLNAEFFWRDQYKHEIDIIISKDNTVIPIEVKYSKSDYKSLKVFMKKFKVDKGIILTYDHLEIFKEENLEINTIPFYEYLLHV